MKLIYIKINLHSYLFLGNRLYLLFIFILNLRLPVCLSVCSGLPVCLSVCILGCLSVYPFAVGCLSVYLFAVGCLSNIL